MSYVNESLCNENFYGPKRDELYIVIPITVIYVVIFITGTVGNITTCIVISRNKSLHTATNYYLFSLAVSDLVLLVSGLPQEIYLIWNRYPYVFGSTFCFLRGLLAETSGNATVLTITGFTVERYLAICHPFLSHTMSKLSRAVKFILFIWTIAISFAIPQAIPLRVTGKCPHCLPNEPVMDHCFEISTFVFFLAPMTLITVLYVLIGSTLRTSSMMKTRSANARIHSKSSKKVVKMLVAVVVAFFICWAPFHVQRLYTIYATFPKPDEETHSLYLKIYALVTYISGVLYYVSATTNPILYNIMSAKFREAFKETFAKCCGLGLQHHKPQRQYSALSKGNVKGPDSTDSAKDDVPTNTTMTHKGSVDSFHTGSSRRIKFPLRRSIQSNESSTKGSHKKQNSSTKTSLQTLNRDQITESKLNKLSQYFECLKKSPSHDKTLCGFNKSTKTSGDLNTTLDLLGQSNRQESHVCQSCDISNSSLKDIEKGAIEDEMTAYMKEIKSRDI